jgi:predicted PurR-regulated permease PerM
MTATSAAPVRDHLERLMPSGGRARRVLGWGVVSWTAIGLAVLIGVGWKLLEIVGGILPFVVTAAAVVFILNPAVTAISARGVPRRLAAVLVFAAAVAATVLLLDILVPAALHQTQELVRTSPGLLRKGGGLFHRLSHSSNPILQHLGEAVTNWVQAHVGSVQRELDTALLAGLKLAHLALVLVLGGFLGFLLLLSLPTIVRSAVALVPADYHERIEPTLREMRRIVGGYVRARLLVSAVVGVLATIGLWAVGMPFWLILGVIVGVANLIPMLGSWIGGIPVAMVALATKPPSFLLLVLAVVTLAHMIDGYVLSPIVLKQTTNLHPVVVLLAVLLGAELAGIWGVLAAIPIAGVAQFMLREWMAPHLAADSLPALDEPAGAEPG